MSKKRRMFDIDLPDDLSGDAPPSSPAAPPAEAASEAGETFPAGKVDARPARRGPMATAISETGESTRARREVEAQIRAENDALAHEHVRLMRLGLVIDLVPLDAVAMSKLIRDRKKGPDFDLRDLKSSIAELGLSNPIRLEARADGGYELIQGYRRLTAYRELLEETGDAEAWGRIPAAVTQPGDTLETLYRKMVDENLVRKDISFGEMAMLAIDYAGNPGPAQGDPDKAVAVLFKSAGYQKRSYIRTFIKVVQRLGKDLRFIEEIPRSLGLALASRIEEVDGIVLSIRSALKDRDNRSVEDELGVLRRFAGQGGAAVDEAVPAGVAGQGAGAPVPAGGARPARARTSFQFDRREGRGKCVAAAGKLEIQLDKDFTTVDRRRLEAAVLLLLDQLDG